MKYIIAFLLVMNSCIAFSTTLNWNLNTLYGVTQNGFSSIILDAKNHFIGNPDDTIIINVDAGTYEIGGNGSNGIHINTVAPGSNGRLIIKGAGIDNTTLVFTEVRQDMIRVSNSNNIVISDMHMTRSVYTVTQGLVQNVGTGYIDLALQDGFPSPLPFFDNTSTNGRYLRRYTNSQTDPQVILTNNGQIPWGYVNSFYTLPELLSENIWRFYLNNPNLLASNYSIGDLVSVKSKHEGETYFIAGGSNILIENIKWTHSTRGVSRFGADNITIKKCRIERGDPINGQTPCMASPSGGPQMNQPNDALATNMVMDSCFIESPGDDCVAFFNVDGGRVTNSVLKNSFSSRGIYIISTAQNICVANTTLINNSIEGPYTACCPDLNVTITGNIVVCDDNSEVFLYSTQLIEGATYAWTVDNGTVVAGQGTNQIQVIWSSGTEGIVEVTVEQ